MIHVSSLHFGSNVYSSPPTGGSMDGSTLRRRPPTGLHVLSVDDDNRNRRIAVSVRKHSIARARDRFARRGAYRACRPSRSMPWRAGNTDNVGEMYSSSFAPGGICSTSKPRAMPLIFVPTPLGNLRDVTLRALDVLREADVDRRRRYARGAQVAARAGARRPGNLELPRAERGRGRRRRSSNARAPRSSPSRATPACRGSPIPEAR